jgi:hypothetical protein
VTRGRELAVLALIVALYALSLGRACSYDFVWDDVPEIANDASFDRPLGDGVRLTQTERGAPDLAGLPSLQFAADSYRPLLYATYWVDIRLWGRDAGALHRTSVVLGGLAVVMAWLLARRWLGGPLALVPTAVFALHPLQIEAVAYVSGRGDVLAGLFAMASAYAALRAAERVAAGAGRRGAVAWTVGAALAFALSLLAKESCLALPVAAAAVVAMRCGLRRGWWIAAALVAVAVGYLALRAAVVSTVAHPAFGAGVVGLPGALLEYARVFALPFDLSIERQARDAYVWIGLAVAVVVIAATLWAWRPPVGAASAGVVWAIALIAPAAIAVRTTGVVADRYAYAPLLGAAIAVTAACAAARAGAWRRVAIAAAALWGLMIAAVSWQQVPVWRDMATLYTHAVDMEPDSASAQYRVAVLDMQAGNWDDAAARLARAIELDPRNVDALNNLGVYALRTGDAARAKDLLARAVAANPAHFRSWLNLGLAELALGDRAGGCASIARALAIDPGYAAAAAAAASCTGSNRE